MPPIATTNKTELAGWLGINRTTLYKWMSEPGFPVNEDGSVSPFEVGKWFVLRDSVQRESQGDLKEEKLRADLALVREKIRMTEIENDNLEGKLISREQVEKDIAAFCVRARSRLSSLADEIAAVVPGEVMATAKAKVQNRVRLVLKELADAEIAADNMPADEADA
ncbi:MAG: hypothetical protein ACE37I_10480 [Rubinisphaera brasiliensis]|uniref:hypothetical protein n=1 Tax=Rubinisphaera brasiliensis TaxID=119 RepID=UPI00391A1E4F